MKKSMAEQFIVDNVEEWDEGILGRDAKHAVVSTSINEEALDEALSLQSINIRMQKSLIEDLKTIATLEGIGYQTLMKQVLQRFVMCEMKRIVREEAEKVLARQIMQAELENNGALRKKA